MTNHFAGNDLTCIRGGRQVFEGLSFTLESGDALILRGPNGSGKSSLLRLMAGLGTPATGAVVWNDTSIGDDRLLHAERLHYVGHKNAVKPALTVRENLDVWAKLQGTGATVDEALTTFDLGHLKELPARLLSSGETRRLALARLVASEAPLWLLDEPTVGLDQASVSSLTDLLSAHRQQGGMVVMSIHGSFAAENSRTLDLGTRRNAA
ncbi:MAG TPA: heme ABC transporter ATP-binding protein CcmA [Rhodospirillaceae bacterium]|nr:heme ABC transporter ATP-binding protein CcmA [Rhodospirillaceae bacterium]HAA91843.1 heme ABC transporter ATP-binding protein CcmA [Rhodospirillaceae bacterium]HAT36110.1 heme ABC transporter ATP-binding protein CcmA [Rhodospirillaceae bacterium]|tara:strand:- start:4 stop:630 length:627 start_codon:yes stop_codon:yes gene_type:complete